MSKKNQVTGPELAVFDCNKASGECNMFNSATEHRKRQYCLTEEGRQVTYVIVILADTGL